MPNPQHRRKGVDDSTGWLSACHNGATDLSCFATPVQTCNARTIGWTVFQTNICPPWPPIIRRDTFFARRPGDYLRFVAALFSPFAHPLYLAFTAPHSTLSELEEYRDDYLRFRFPDDCDKKYNLYQIKESPFEGYVNADWAR